MGFFVATGPDLGAGRCSSPVSVMDFAPTIEAWSGLSPTPGAGRPIVALRPGNNHLRPPNSDAGNGAVQHT
jgi:hypothetical protein